MAAKLKFGRELRAVLKKKMILISVISLVVSFVSGVLYAYTKNRAFFPVAVTFGTMFYHLAMRLAVGTLIDAKYHNRMDYTKNWFLEKPFEKKLYKRLKVRKWKKYLPTLNPEDFDLKNRSLEEIIQVTCQAEVVHEIILPLSFVPVIFSIWFGSLDVFIITSCVSFLFDGLLVMMQRYNRPRLMRLLKRKS